MARPYEAGTLSLFLLPLNAFSTQQWMAICLSINIMGDDSGPIIIGNMLIEIVLTLCLIYIVKIKQCLADIHIIRPNLSHIATRR